MPYKDPEKQRECDRRRRQDPRRLEYMRQYAQLSVQREKQQQRREANREANAERARQHREAGYVPPRKQRRNEVLARLWHEQSGCCYLCGRAVPLDQAHLEHDHRCCPEHGGFCDLCVRGAACSVCNLLIGHAKDDPDLLELIARNLRAKLAEVDVRLTVKPEQMTL